MSIILSLFNVFLWIVAGAILLFYGVLALHIRRKVREVLTGQVVVVAELNAKQKENFLRSYLLEVKQFYFIKALMMLVLVLIFLYLGIQFVAAVCFCLAVANFYQHKVFVA